MITYPISAVLLALPSWTHYVLLLVASLVTFLTLRGRRFSLATCSAISAFGAAYGIGNLFFHAQNGAIPSLAVMTQAPYTASLWIVAGAATLICAIVASFWKGFGLFFSGLLFGFAIGLLVANRLMFCILLGFFIAFFQLLSPSLLWLLSSTLAGSLWAGEAMGLILHNGRWDHVLLWSAGFFAAGVLFQWAINRDLFRRQSLAKDPDEKQPDQNPPAFDTPPLDSAPARNSAPSADTPLPASKPDLASADTASPAVKADPLSSDTASPEQIPRMQSANPTAYAAERNPDPGATFYPSLDKRAVPPPTPYPSLTSEEKAQPPYASLQTSKDDLAPYSALRASKDDLAPYSALQASKDDLAPYSALQASKHDSAPYSALQTSNREQS